MSSLSHTLPSIVTLGASALTLSVPLAIAVELPVATGTPPEKPKSAGPAAGVLSTRMSIAVVARLPAVRCIASTRSGVSAPISEGARRARRSARRGDRCRRYGFVLVFHARNLYGR